MHNSTSTNITYISFTNSASELWFSENSSESDALINIISNSIFLQESDIPSHDFSKEINKKHNFNECLK
jgi:hypothetical protein